jgi:hypothetical protein
MVTEEEYKLACLQKDSAEDIIIEYNNQKNEEFKERLKNNPIFTDDELFYSATVRCPCGAGLAYPKGCTPFHYWDCSDILKGIQDNSVKHTAQLPFTMYEVKGESERNGTTRPKKE